MLTRVVISTWLAVNGNSLEYKFICMDINDFGMHMMSKYMLNYYVVEVHLANFKVIVHNVDELKSNTILLATPISHL